MVSLRILVKIASIGGFVTAGTGYIFMFLMQNKIKKTENYKDAMDALRTHKKAVPYFGEPIRLGHVKYGDGQRENRIPYKWFKIPIRGTHTKGNMYYEVTLNQKLENKPEVSRIEITFDNIPGKTFVIRDNIV
ncbi:PREDICTED: uncharacterized protein LOC106744344 [Dinoponera quadriceps]|uniref:Uncharacterized protein LOC106744344 n=1 Tax=Dinoponera quadriceps TaxID=609295 RepID=A0A6P3X8F1_DINQU|nr:PREDICTED: uncharacterized protein LOC106744344 [Dinoponera quadriceps]XP_014474508.1 PREDICTED: uncharacterized protein LOC106744344 [Dinoponera quadriceps]